MKEKVKFYGSILIIIIFIPYLLTLYLHGSRFQLFFNSGSDEQLEQQVVCVLASEMPADYELECLKAQAVIARTNLYREQGEESDHEEDAIENDGESGNSDMNGDQSSEADGENNNSDSGEESTETGWSENQMRAAWGEDYEKNLEKIETAVSETEGQVLTFDENAIMAAFHTACNGKTRNAKEVPGQEDYVYLQSVECEDDILADGFLYIGYMQKEEFANALQELFPEETLDGEQLPDALQIVERDSAGYVTRVQYGATIVNGEAVRTALGLKSSCFYFSTLEGKIRIVTKGIGHGLGFSQYGAQQLALKGWDYEELLEYFYSGAEVETIKSGS